MTNTGNNIDSTKTRNRQQEEQQQEKQDQYKYQDNYYYNNYNITRTRACSDGDLPGNEVMGQIAEAYRANIGPVITQAAAQLIEQALRNGMEPATVILAIEETGLASRPSPYYLRAVLRNWAEWGVISSRAREQNGITAAKPWWR